MITDERIHFLRKQTVGLVITTQPPTGALLLNRTQEILELQRSEWCQTTKHSYQRLDDGPRRSSWLADFVLLDRSKRRLSGSATRDRTCAYHTSLEKYSFPEISAQHIVFRRPAHPVLLAREPPTSTPERGLRRSSEPHEEVRFEPTCAQLPRRPRAPELVHSLDQSHGSQSPPSATLPGFIHPEQTSLEEYILPKVSAHYFLQADQHALYLSPENLRTYRPFPAWRPSPTQRTSRESPT
ncbi:hypothetical protein THAOC_36428 [Thalassiosira oceanica]|uniref:Uncharacterized protein n=1 Tax=Thalassiosira oceanica TaxID=159749 RepID=K0R073_THAOC|nr:hypothetical protein THAOC_36428 [Thalassiosira oceanica]|eukprot:EJK44990.1 hypothetical protein THAOC_36428 [Thalassiosira oceanica]